MLNMCKGRADVGIDSNANTTLKHPGPLRGSFLFGSPDWVPSVPGLFTATFNLTQVASYAGKLMCLMLSLAILRILYQTKQLLAADHTDTSQPSIKAVRHQQYNHKSRAQTLSSLDSIRSACIDRVLAGIKSLLDRQY